MDVSIVGLGKLGLPLAAVMAANGLEVVGVDINLDVVRSVRECKPLIYEPELEETMREAGENLVATTALWWAVEQTDATIILVPTPSDENGLFSLRYVLEVCKELGRILGGKSEYHLVIMSSTVMPSSCEGEIKTVLETTSGKACGDEWGLCYCPEFVALGEVIKGFQEPAFILVGSSDKQAQTAFMKLYSRFYFCFTPWPRAFYTNLVNAEIAKLALNCYVTTKISFANQIAELCEKIPGANVDDVTDAIGMDPRIGSLYLTGATSFGGECFPRDVRAMLALAENHEAELPLMKAVNEINHHQIERLVELIHNVAGRLKVMHIGIYGLAFKSFTDVTTESTGTRLIEELDELFAIHTYDPIVPGTCATMQEMVDRAAVIVLTRPYEGTVPKFSQGHVVIDCWRTLDGDQVRAAGAYYMPIGVG